MNRNSGPIREALHPETNDLISVDAYLIDLGRKPVKATAEPPRARCPICRQQLAVVASNSPESVGHFAHLPRSSYCPTKDTSRSPYLDLRPTNPDPARARAIRELFSQDWQNYFAFLDYMVKFCSLVRLADDKQIWAYRGLELSDVPYVMLTLADFAPATSERQQRRYWFRFWFDTSVRTFEDLWIHRTDPAQFYRAWYEPPRSRRKRPRYEDMLRHYSQPIRSEFLAGKRGASPTPDMSKVVAAKLRFPLPGTALPAKPQPPAAR